MSPGCDSHRHTCAGRCRRRHGDVSGFFLVDDSVVLLVSAPLPLEVPGVRFLTFRLLCFCVAVRCCVVVGVRRNVSSEICVQTPPPTPLCCSSSSLLLITVWVLDPRNVQMKKKKKLRSHLYYS